MSLAGAARADVPDIEVSVEKRDATFYVDTAFDAPVSVRVAWEVLTDFDQMATILHNLTSSRIVSRSGNRLRVHQEGVARFGPFSYAFVSEREIQLAPRKRIHVEQVSGNARRYASDMEISANGNGTHFQYHAEIVLESGLARFFGGPFIQHEIAEQFAALVTEMRRRQQRL